MPLPIIAFSGLAGAGKSTCANFFLERGFIKIAFADPLRDMLKAGGMSVYYTFPENKNKPIPEFCGRTYRELMQTLGTEWGREEVGWDVWARLWEARVVDAVNKAASGDISDVKGVVCDDLRFSNEVQAVERLHGYTAHVTRSDIKPKPRKNWWLTPWRGRYHISERLSYTPTFEVLNKFGAYDELEAQLQDIYEYII